MSLSTLRQSRLPCVMNVIDTLRFLCCRRSQGHVTAHNRETWSPGSPSLRDRECSTRSRQTSQVPESTLCIHALLSDPGWLDVPPSLSTVECCLPRACIASASHDSTTFQDSMTRPAYSLFLCFTVRLRGLPRRIRYQPADGLWLGGTSPTG